MCNSDRRHDGWLWLARWLWPLGLGLLPLVAVAQGQHEAAVEAMQPPRLAGPVLVNKIAPVGFGRVDNSLRKQALRDVARLAAAPTPPAPTPAEPQPPEPGPGAQPNATQPTPGPNAKPLPLENPEQVRLRADELHTKNGETEATGNVEVRYQDITIHSFVGRLDKDRVWGTFSGDVTMDSKLYNATADEMRVNLDTN